MTDLMYVMTLDQRGSRRDRDRVPELLDALAGVDAELPFTRTVGDEVQALLAEPDAVLDALVVAWRHGGWSAGIGIGEVELPLGATAPESRGRGFIAAREAVERAKNSWFPLAVEAGERRPETDHATLVRGCQTGLRLLGNLVAGCTDGQWRFASRLLERPDLTQAQLAAEFRVSQQAVSKSLRASAAAGIVEGREMSRAQLAAVAESLDGLPDGRDDMRKSERAGGIERDGRTNDTDKE